MCEVCEHQFSIMSQQFDGAFAEYLGGHAAGLTRDTPATRVHDLSFVHEALCNTEQGRIAVSWFLAIAMERLMALECAGIPT
jgi:hypothetical protein